MTDQIKQRVLKSLMGFMRPVAGFLLRAGISYRDFSEIAKKAFVDTAIEAYGVRGRPTNVSRVALLTGLTRKEVKQVKASAESSVDVYGENRSLPAEVLHRWYTASHFIDTATGLPLDLHFSGAEPCFSSLVRECMRDIPPGAVRTELKRIGAVVEGPGGLLRAIKREVVPIDAEERLAEGLETGLTPLARTIVFNSDPGNKGTPRFQRVVSIPFIRRGSLESIETAIGDRLVTISESLDDFLANYEVDEGAPDKEPGFGIGLYYYREE